MIKVTGRLVSIDEDVIVSELVDSWINGNRRYVIDILKVDHPGLTAFFLSEMIKVKPHRMVVDINSVVNMLMDDRVELLRE